MTATDFPVLADENPVDLVPSGAGCGHARPASTGNTASPSASDSQSSHGEGGPKVTLAEGGESLWQLVGQQCLCGHERNSHLHANRKGSLIVGGCHTISGVRPCSCEVFDAAYDWWQANVRVMVPTGTTHPTVQLADGA